MAKNKEHLELGVAGEDVVLRFFLKQGWKIQARNWRPKGAAHGLELDLIAKHDGCIIFVEVKTRTAADSIERNSPKGREERRVPVYAAFTPQKQKKIIRAAYYYLTAHKLWDKPCRFDLACVERDADGRLLLEHYTNVIELGHSMDRGDASWQPW